MRLSHRLEEAVHVLSDDDLLSVLSEDVIHDMRAGDFTPERAEEAMVSILGSYGLTEDDADLVDEAIEEFGEAEGLSEGFLDWLKGAAKKALKAVGSAALDAAKEGGKEAISMSAKELKKKLAAKQKQDKDDNKKSTDADDEEEEPKKKKAPKPKKKEPEPKDDDDDDDDGGDDDDIKGKLKGIAGKTLGKIADDPARAKELLKKGGKKAAKALAKHGVKKGMKMVFGRWIKTGGGSKKEWLEWTTGNDDIDKAVRWLIAEAESHQLGDGSLAYDFEGNVPGWVTEAFDFGVDGTRFTWSGQGRRLSFDPGDDGETSVFMMTEVEFKYPERRQFYVAPRDAELITSVCPELSPLFNELTKDEADKLSKKLNKNAGSSWDGRLCRRYALTLSRLFKRSSKAGAS
jgi:hypothetical protein